MSAKAQAPKDRAPKKMGHIGQRKNGRWVWQMGFGTDPITNKRDRATRERATRDEAIEAGREYMNKRQAKMTPAPAPEPGSVSEWYTEWLHKVAARPDGSPNTYANYETQVRLRIIPKLGNKVLSRLTTDEVTEMLDSIGSAPTRASVHKVMARGWREAYDAGRVLDRDVVIRSSAKRTTPVDGKPVARATTKEEVEAKMLALVAHPPMTMVRSKSMPDEDIGRVFRSLEPDRMRARFILGLITGPRQSEAMGFCWPWLEAPGSPGDPAVLNLHTTRVRELYAHGCHERKPCGLSPARCPHRQYLDPIKSPKTDGSIRQLFLGPGMYDILLDWKGLQTLELSRLERPPVIPWMFTTEMGKPLSHSTDAKNWQKILKRAEVSRHYTLHDLRRTAASEAAADPTVDKVTLMGMFGWTRSTTADLYTRPQDNRLKAAFNRQDERFTGPGRDEDRR